MYEVSFVSSKPKKNSWSTCVGHRSDDEKEYKKRGEILILMALGSEIDFDFEKLGGMLIDEIQESYYYSTQYTDPLSQVESAVAMMTKRVDQLLDKEPGLMEAGLDMQSAILVIKDDIAYLSIIGESKAVLIREGEYLEVDAHLQDMTGKDFLRTGSFQIDSESDSILLMTNVAYETVGKKSLKEAAEKLDLGQFQGHDESPFTIAMVIGSERVAALMSQGSEEEIVEEEVSEEETLESEGVAAMAADEEQQGESEEQDEEELLVEEEVDEQENVDVDDIEEEMEEIQKKPLAKATKGRADYLSKLKQIDFTKVKGTVVSVRDKVANSTYYQKFHSATSSMIANATADNGGGQKTYQVIIRKVVSNVVVVWRKAVDIFRVQILGNKPGDRAMYLNGRKQGRNWRLIVVIIVVVLAILYIVINNAIENRNQEIMREEVSGEIMGISTDASNFESDIISLTAGIGNEQERLDKIEELQKEISEVRSIDLSEIKENSDLQTQKEELVKRYEALIDELREITVISNPTLIADLGINFQNVNATDIAYHEGFVYVSDSGNSAIYKVAVTGGSTPVKFSDKDLLGPVTLAVDKNGDLIVFDQDAESSVGTVSLGDGSVQKHVGGLNVSNVGIPKNISTYRHLDEDRLYWIDSASKELKWLSRSPVGGYGSAPNIRKTDNSFADVIDIAVSDGRIFLLNKEIGVIRYYGTEVDNYTLVGLLPDDSLAGMDAFEVTKNNIYLADSSKRRIVVLSKARNGSDPKFIDVQGQYVNRDSDGKFSDIVDIVFDSKNNQIYILDGLKIYQIKAYEN